MVPLMAHEAKGKHYGFMKQAAGNWGGESRIVGGSGRGTVKVHFEPTSFSLLSSLISSNCVGSYVHCQGLTPRTLRGEYLCRIGM